MKYLCPVCGYNKLNAPPQDDMICPCCGTHFGYDDYAHSYAEIRRVWLDAGAKWFSRRILPPVGWNVELQMMYAGLCQFNATIYVKTMAHIERVEVEAKPTFEWDHEPTSITYYLGDWRSPQNGLRQNVNLTSVAV